VIAFVLIATLMLAVALAWILVPLLRRRSTVDINREVSNVAILRDQLRELEADVAIGTMPAERLEQARRELEQRVLEESTSSATPGEAPLTRAGAWSAIAVGALVPIAAAVIYAFLGNPEAFAPQAQQSAAPAGAHGTESAQVEDMVAKLAAKLENEPSNTEGWVVLARTYYTMKRFPEAARAFEKAVALTGDVPDLLADYADTLGAAQGGNLQGKPMELVQRALKVDPTHWKALALAGTAAFEQKDYRKAVEYWERLKPTVPPDSDIARSIDASIAEARELGGLPAGPVATAPMAVPLPKTSAAQAPVQTAATALPAAPGPRAAAPASPTAAASGTSVSGNVKLGASVAGKAAPTDTVFIFARPAEGSRMPLAIMRVLVKDLPASFTLDDSMAMTPEMKISAFPEIVVGARVSKTGSAMPSPGDLEGLSKPLKGGTRGIAIVIDSARP
jgi:cytochrome c-type biogenesis protein CcmH